VPLPLPFTQRVPGAPARRVEQVAMRHTFFPSVLIQLICLERRSTDQFTRQRIVEIDLDLLTQLAEAFAIKAEVTREPCSTFAFGNPAQQQNDGGRRLMVFANTLPVRMVYVR
jgi:hypothetical protein